MYARSAVPNSNLVKMNDFELEGDFCDLVTLRGASLKKSSLWVMCSLCQECWQFLHWRAPAS